MHIWADKKKNDSLIWMKFRKVLTHLIYEDLQI